jgi:ABC-type uncharacterized transport system permease subunit
MSEALLSVACHAYGLAAVLYLVHLIRQWRALPIIGRGLVAVGLGLHGVALGMALSEHGGLPAGLGEGLSAVALLLLAIFLALDVRYRTPVLGAFLTPIALAVLVPGLLLHGAGSPLPPGVRRPLLPLHVTIALLGIAAFAVAAGIALMYLLMERQVKGKRFGLLFSRLPSLEFLDELNRRLVVGGFILLSVTLVTGAFFANGTGGVFWQWEAKEIATLIAWIIFAAVLSARSFAGWQGRRVAFITMAGFCFLLVSLVTSYPLHSAHVLP